MNPFEQVPLADSRERTSIKWRFFEPDVLPMWVAEMDVLPAEPITEAVHAAMLRGDTGYPHGTGYAEAFGRSRGPLGAAVDVGPHRARERRHDGRVRADPAADPARRLRDRHEPRVSAVPRLLGHAERRVVEAPLGRRPAARPRGDRGHCGAPRHQHGRGAAAVQSHNPTGTCTPGGSSSRSPRSRTATARAVILDEVHAPLLFDATFTPYWTVDPPRRSLLT